MERNKELACLLTKAQNQQDKATLLEILDPNFQSHISDWPNPLSRDQFIAGVAMAHKAFSDLVFTIEDVITEGDKVVLRIVARGRHTGVYRGMPPTNKQIIMAGIAIRRISQGKIVEEWQTNDQLGLLQQISSDFY